MKKNIYILSLIGCFLFTSCNILLPHPMDLDDDDESTEYLDDENESASSDGSFVTPTKKDDKKIRQFITKFYNTYKGGGYSDAQRKTMMTEQLKACLDYIQRYEKTSGYIILDSDPFINAQDIVGGMYSGEFSIEKAKENDVAWIITYDGGGEIIKTAVAVVIENGEYKIADVLMGGESSVVETANEIYNEESNSTRYNEGAR